MSFNESYSSHFITNTNKHYIPQDFWPVDVKPADNHFIEYPPYTMDVISVDNYFPGEYPVLWLDTVYFYFHHDFHAMRRGHSFRSRNFTITGLEGNFYLTVAKTSVGVEFELHRVPLEPSNRPREGYYLTIKFHLIRSSNDNSRATMEDISDIASVTFPLSEISKGINILKLVIWMYEYETIAEVVPNSQENNLQDRIKRFFSPTQKQYKDMAYLLGRPKFQNILTGRQNKTFADEKTRLILQSFKYASELARKTRCLQHNEIYAPETDLGEILGYIYKHDSINHYPDMIKPIEKKECLELYLASVHHGLLYLKRECAEYIMEILNNDDVEYIVRILVSAEFVEDEVLQNKLVEYLVKNEIKICESPKWKNVLNKYPGVAENIKNTLKKMCYSDEDNDNDRH